MKVKDNDLKDLNVPAPSMHTHHDKAMRARDFNLSTFEKSPLAPNCNFENSLGRDNKMYHLSDLSNLEAKKVIREVNQLDRYLTLENILPHQNTLARGYQNGHYDYPAVNSI